MRHATGTESYKRKGLTKLYSASDLAFPMQLTNPCITVKQRPNIKTYIGICTQCTHGDVFLLYNKNLKKALVALDKPEQPRCNNIIT